MQGHVDMAIQKSSRFSIVMIDFSNLLHLNFDLFTPVVFENIFYLLKNYFISLKKILYESFHKKVNVLSHFVSVHLSLNFVF